MTRPNNRSRRNKRLAAAATAVLVLAGCGPLVQIGGNAEPPEAVFTLRADPAPASPQARSSDPAATLRVEGTTVPGALQTLRLPVITRDTELAYLVGAAWVEQPNQLFTRLLLDTIAARTPLTVLNPRQSGIPAARELSGQLMEFGLDVRDPAAPSVRLRYDATLTTSDGRLIATRRFDQTMPTPSQMPRDVAATLNQAANQMAAQVSDWVVSAR